MKKGYILGAVGLILLGLGTSACSTSSSTSESQSHSKSSKSEKVENAVSDSSSRGSQSHSTAGFKGNTYTTKTGSITINKVTNVKVHDDSMDPENYTMVVIEGTFTNKSKKAVAPYEWVMSNLEINQVFPNSERELEVPSSRQQDNGTKWDNLFKNSESKVLPGKTIKFALEYDLDSKSDKVSATYNIQAESAEDGHHIGKPYVAKAGTDSFAKKDDDDSFDTSDNSSEDTDSNDDSSADFDSSSDTNNNSNSEDTDSNDDSSANFDSSSDTDNNSNNESKDNDSSSEKSDEESSDKNSNQNDEDTNNDNNYDD